MKGKEKHLLVSLITWNEMMDVSSDDIRVAKCIEAALESLPRNITDKISGIEIKRS